MGMRNREEIRTQTEEKGNQLRCNMEMMLQLHSEI